MNTAEKITDILASLAETEADYVSGRIDAKLAELRSGVLRMALERLENPAPILGWMTIGTDSVGMPIFA